MRRYIVAAVAALFTLTVVSSTAHAQRPISFGIAGGATVPLGDLGDDTETGFNLMGVLDFGAPLIPVGFRIDGMWSQLGATGAGDDHRILALTGNVRYAMAGVGMRPYLIGGLGFYNQSQGTIDENDFGINAGVGVEFLLAGFSTFGEIRFHNIFADPESAQFLPISFGLKF